MTNSNQTFKSVVKDRLFFNQFSYCLGFFLDEVSCLRILDHKNIDEFIERRKQWREISRHRQIHGTIISRRWKEITDTTVKNLHDLAEILLTTNENFKLVVSANNAYVYTSSLDLINQLDSLEFLLNKRYTAAKISRPKNTVALKNSKFQSRSYFKFQTVTHKQKENLVNFFKNQQEHIRISPGLKSWFERTETRVQDYFFIDYTGETWLSMLSLVHPGLVRKTMQIFSGK